MSTRDDELLWLAFRYVSGELAEDEANQLEQRLADDDPDREAIERAIEQAVELERAIHCVFAEAPSIAPSIAPPGAVPIRPRRWDRMGWLAAVSAALLVAACAYWLSRPDANMAGTAGSQERGVIVDQAEIRGDVDAQAIEASKKAGDKAGNEASDEESSMALAWARLRSQTEGDLSSLEPHAAAMESEAMDTDGVEWGRSEFQGNAPPAVADSSPGGAVPAWLLTAMASEGEFVDGEQ